MSAGQLIAEAGRLEHRAGAATTEQERLQLAGEALVCRGLAWIKQATEMP